MSGPGEVVPTARPETDEDLEPDFSYEDLLEELAAQMETEPPEGAITVRMLMDRKGVTEPVARRFLNKRVTCGELKTGIFGNTRYYWKCQ